MIRVPNVVNDGCFYVFWKDWYVGHEVIIKNQELPFWGDVMMLNLHVLFLVLPYFMTSLHYCYLFGYVKAKHEYFCILSKWRWIWWSKKALHRICEGDDEKCFNEAIGLFLCWKRFKFWIIKFLNLFRIHKSLHL